MTETDYIRRAVELADDIWPWDFYKFNLDSIDDKQQFTQRDKDALAAQLVRQVDALKSYNLWVTNNGAAIWSEIKPTPYGDKRSLLNQVEGPDRTMNTIKAIVDSGVLDIGEQS